MSTSSGSLVEISYRNVNMWRCSALRLRGYDEAWTENGVFCFRISSFCLFYKSSSHKINKPSNLSIKLLLTLCFFLTLKQTLNTFYTILYLYDLTLSFTVSHISRANHPWASWQTGLSGSLD